MTLVVVLRCVLLERSARSAREHPAPQTVARYGCPGVHFEEPRRLMRPLRAA